MDYGPVRRVRGLEGRVQLYLGVAGLGPLSFYSRPYCPENITCRYEIVIDWYGGILTPSV